jgi:capsular polysaccharide biosynthesis protein
VEQLQGLVDDLYPGKFTIRPMRSPIIRVRELIYPGPISLHNARKSRTLLRFADRLHRVLATSDGSISSKRLYISREGMANRNMENEAEIRSCFEAHGYVSVHPERMTLREQASLFAAATHIAGPLGAGLANTVFAPEQAEILMIDPGMYDFFFWDLACLRKQRFSWHFSAPLAPFDVGRLHGNYTVPADPVRQTLKALD